MMKRRLSYIIAAFLIETINATDNDSSTTASILNDMTPSIAAVDEDAAKKIAVTMDGLLHMFTVLSTATSLSALFLKYIFNFLIQSITYTCSPFVWVLAFCWRQFITKPFNLLLYLIHVFYPVIMFCIAAMCCGIFIGGCAGFAAEAFSSILISATWGPQPPPSSQQEKKKELALFTNENELEEEEEEVESIIYSSFDRSKNDSVQSLSTFFGTTKKKKGKELLLQQPPITRIENWRESLNNNGSSSSSSNLHPLTRSASPPALIRRMKLSSTTSSRNSWGWDDDED
ncbi:MAG: hypothetical protein EXX96DRAFT_192679 [Benjaminiella poitrasii]|nr:MAG: hypothetical protein EXX96DRAFT_192679 [Benjaminiella poitrasii]